MAIMRQYSGLVGRKVKPNYVSAINSQTPYLYSMKQAKDTADYQSDMLDLREKELAQNKELSDASLALSEDALKQQEEQNKRSNLYSGLNLGANLGLGYMKYKAGDPANIYSASDAASNLAPTSVDSIKTSLTDYGEEALSDTAKDATAGSLLEGVTDVSNWTGALTKPKTYATGLGAGAAGGAIGKELFGDNDLTGALSGMATAGLTEYLTGGNIYSSITSGLLGGIGGLLF